MLLQFYLFIALILLIIALVLIGPSVIPNMIIGICNQVVIIYLIVTMGYKELPFSRSLTNSQRSGMFLRSIFMLIICGAMGVFHFFVFKNTIALISMFVVSVSSSFFLMTHIKKISWHQLKVAEENMG